MTSRPLRVLLCHPGASSSTADVEAGLRYGLEQHQVEVIRFRLDERIDRSARWLHAAWRKASKRNPSIEKPTMADIFYQAGLGALERALRFQVDVVLVVSAMFLHPDVIILMKRAGLRVCVLFTESPYDTQKELRVAGIIDGCWTNERSVVASFQQVCRQVGYLPHAWHPERHLPGPKLEDQQVPAHDVVFVGTAFRERVEWLQAVDWTGIDLGLYGNWQTLGSRSSLRQFVRDTVPINNITTASLYRRAKIGLNLYRESMGWGRFAPRIAAAESLNPRAYELAACGAFHLSQDRAEVREVFGDLVPTFRTPIEAAALIRAWLVDEPGRQRVAAQLPARVAESSWADRAACVIGDLQTLLAARAA